MRIVALVTENKHGMAVDLHPSFDAAVADVRRELVEHYDLDETEAATMDAADLGQWVGEEGHTYSFTIQEIDAPVYRVTVTDLTTEKTLSDRLLLSSDLESARSAMGVDWNRFGFGHDDREVILWGTYSDDPIDRIRPDLKPLTEANVAHLTDENVRRALLGDRTCYYLARKAAEESWWADNNEGDKVALDLEPKAYERRQDAILAMDELPDTNALTEDQARTLAQLLRNYWL